MNTPTWYVYDPSPADNGPAMLYGPFPHPAAAEDYANALHPDDGSGNTVILSPVAP